MIKIDFQCNLYKWVPRVSCLMTANTSSREHVIRYIDCGCSRHMTGNLFIFSSFILYDRGVVTFGDNSEGKIGGMECVTKSLIIENVYLVDELKNNLLSVMQIKRLSLNHLCAKFKIEILMTCYFVVVGKTIFTLSKLICLMILKLHVSQLLMIKPTFGTSCMEF